MLTKVVNTDHDVTYRPTAFISKAEREYLNLMKRAIIDVFVTTEDGSRALVEIQKGTDRTDSVTFPKK